MVIFNPLSPETIREIVEIQLELVRGRLRQKNLGLEMTPAALDWLAREGFSREYGVRPLKRLIQNKILNPVAELIIARKVEHGGTIMVDLKDNAPAIEFRKTYRRQRLVLPTEASAAK